MMRMQASAVVMTLCILAAFLLGPLLHNTIAHSHANDHHGAPSSMWGEMHSSLRHEDKQLLATVEIVLATFLALIALVRVMEARALPQLALAGVRLRQESLHSGREQYRRFG